MGKVLKGMAFLIATVLIMLVSAFAIFLFGNPVSYLLARFSAERHLSENYPDTDYEIGNVRYAFTNNNFYGYWVGIVSPSSIDTHFNLIMNLGGELVNDEYEKFVASGRNTRDRLYFEYKDMVETIFEHDGFSYDVRLGFGELHFKNDYEGFEKAMPAKEVELDKIYDVSELGRTGGEIHLTINAHEITVEKMAEILLETKRIADELGVGFYAMDFLLKHPDPQIAYHVEGNYMAIDRILYSEIYEEGMVERVRELYRIADTTVS